MQLPHCFHSHVFGLFSSNRSRIMRIALPERFSVEKNAMKKKQSRKSFQLAAMSVISMALGSIANQSAKAATLYFDANGTSAGYGISNGGTYSWDDANWATATGGTSATSNWVQGSFAEFVGGSSGNTYTVTVSGDEQNAGWYQTVAGVNLTINAIGSGQLDVTTGVQGVLNKSSVTMTVNAPITGVGGIEPENGGNIDLYGNNTYSGGTTLGSSSTLTYFNNNNSFGTGTITNALSSATSFTSLLSSGGTSSTPLTITLPNNFAMASTDTAGGNINFGSSSYTPVVSTGTWSLGAVATDLRNNGDSTAPLTLSNTISGTSSLLLSGASGGAIILSGDNTFSGPVTVGQSGDASVILRLAAAGTLSHASQIVLAGGTLDPDGLMQTMGSTTMGMTVSSKIDFNAGASEIDFANSSAVNWTAGTVLNLANFTPGTDFLRFGTDPTGLTSTQLAEIEYDGNAATLGTAVLDPNGYVDFPEPASLSMLGLGAMSLLARRRK